MAQIEGILESQFSCVMSVQPMHTDVGCDECSHSCMYICFTTHHVRCHHACQYIGHNYSLLSCQCQTHIETVVLGSQFYTFIAHSVKILIEGQNSK